VTDDLLTALVDGFMAEVERRAADMAGAGSIEVGLSPEVLSGGSETAEAFRLGVSCGMTATFQTLVARGILPSDDDMGVER